MPTKNIFARRSAEAVLVAALLAVGLFYEFSAHLTGAVLGVILILLFVKRKRLDVCLNLTFISTSVIALFYALSILWATDRGAALPGFFRFLPVLLFLVLLMQTEKEEKDKIFRAIPHVAVSMTVISAALSFIPPFKEVFTVAGRLSGFFAYPNTFALFLLVALIMTLTEKKAGILSAVYSLILLGGILYSGSRTVFVLTVISLICTVFTVKNKRLKWAVVTGAAVTVLAAVIGTLLYEGYSVFGRFLTISLSSSTFVGRLLYFKDALTLILEHPFGTGYLGYYYLQQGVQTGVYSVRFVHNDLLQLVLDVGFIPALLFAASVIKSIFSRSTPFSRKLILLVFGAHACFDFDLQFIAMLMLFVALTDTHSGKWVTLKRPVCFSAVTGALSLASLWFAVAFALMSLGAHEASRALYGDNTQNDVALLINAEELQDMELTADRIIERNENVTLAYSAKARCAYSKGDFSKVIEYKNKVFDIAPFAYEEYEEYCTMLITGISLYERAGDKSSADVCRRELISCRDRLASNDSRLSHEGRMIKDQPTTVLPLQIVDYIEKTEEYFDE